MGERGIQAWATGLVQGVAFRWWTRETALELGLEGWVCNLRDGRVEVHAWGSEEAVGEFVARLRRGPPAAQVTDLRVVEAGGGAPDGVRGFEIRR